MNLQPNHPTLRPMLIFIAIWGVLAAISLLVATILTASPANAATCVDRWPCEASWSGTPKKSVSRTRHRHRRPMLIGNGVNAKLLSAYRYVGGRCKGVRIVSGVRKTFVSGTRRRSLHWSGNAIDFRAKSYKCAYRALRSYGWKGGWARDGSRCGHIHISYGGSRREPAGFRHRRC